MKLIIVELVSFGLNIPLGMWRVRTKKFSLSWFISIHIAMPIIYFLRVSQSLGYWTIPISIVFSIIGQLMGGSLSEKYRKLNFNFSNKMSVVKKFNWR